VSSVKYYRDLLRQKERIEAFQSAVKAVVQPGDRVLEVGTGLGTFAFFAADAGAGRVYAVDGHPIIHLAKTIGTAARYGDRVRFMRGWIPHVSIPEPCDVLIFEGLPARLIDSSVFRMLQNVHRDYVTDDVRAIPRRATICVAPVSSEAAHSEVLSLELNDGELAYGIDWSPSREYVVNAPGVPLLESKDLVGAPEVVGELWFNRPPDGWVLGGEATWRLTRRELVHGLAYWFDLELAPDEWLSNAPGAFASWGYLFLPCDPPLAVSPDTALQAAVGLDTMPDGAPGWMSWSLSAGGTTFRGHEFASEPASLEDLILFTPDGIPILEAWAQLERAVLRLTDGRRSIREIAAELRSQHRDLTETEAERLVMQILSGRARSAQQPAVGVARSER
jgi:hypothetical protein